VLQQHENHDIYKAALSIIDRFFSEVSTSRLTIDCTSCCQEEEDTAVAPQTNTDSGLFQFSTVKQPANFVL